MMATDTRSDRDIARLAALWAIADRDADDIAARYDRKEASSEEFTAALEREHAALELLKDVARATATTEPQHGEQMPRYEFQLPKLNDRGNALAATANALLSDTLVAIEEMIPAGRERSLVVTKLQEAHAFLLRGIALDPQNQEY
jgi:hypothetical protein